MPKAGSEFAASVLQDLDAGEHGRVVGNAGDGRGAGTGDVLAQAQGV